jgi:hypothetical protein
MTLLYDSDQPASIPDGVWAAGYVDGYAAGPRYWGAPGAWDRFPGAKRIAVFASTNDGDVLDVESGDATPDQVPGWVSRRRNAGVLVPWVYCNRSNRRAVELQLNSAGILSDQVALWIATLDGTQTVPVGPYIIAAVQYANSASSGGHYDISIVNDQFGPGHGTIGEDMTPDQAQILGDMSARVLVLFHTIMGEPDASGNTVHPTPWEKLQADVAALKPGTGGGTEPVEPKTITLDIPSVPGKATGTLS